MGRSGRGIGGSGRTAGLSRRSRDEPRFATAARNMLGKHVAYDEIPWFWSDQFEANLQYAGCHVGWEHLVVRGRLDSGSFLACYVNGGCIDAVVGLNRGKDVRSVMQLIKARHEVSLEQLADERIDLRSFCAACSV